MIGSVQSVEKEIRRGVTDKTAVYSYLERHYK